MDRETLIHEVVEQIRRDLERGVPMPLYEMLNRLPEDDLAAYLPECEEG